MKPRSFFSSKVQRRPNLAAPGISPHNAIACTVRAGNPKMPTAISVVIRSAIVKMFLPRWEREITKYPARTWCARLCGRFGYQR
jgi:hypothetical protein